MSGFLVFDTRSNDPDYVANQYKSSENSDYPLSNALDMNRRLRTWRTKGYFKVVSGSNTLVFRETVGVDLTATITAGEYATDALFIAAVKAALDAAGDSTYTVSRDSTSGRLKIASNGSGGGGIFQLILTDVNSAGVASLMGYDTSANRTGALTYEADLIRIHSSEWVMWDMGFPVNPTAFIAVTDRNTPLQVSPTATLKIQGNSTDNFSSPELDLTVNYSDFVLHKISESGLATNTYGYRYWRFYLEDKDNPDLYVELGVLFLGLHVVTTRGCPGFPFESDDVDLSNVQISDAGQANVGARPQSEMFSLNWGGLNTASKELLENVFKAYGLHTSFFVAMDNDEAYSSDNAHYVRLVKFASAPKKTLISVGIWAYSWELREEL